MGGTGSVLCRGWQRVMLLVRGLFNGSGGVVRRVGGLRCGGVGSEVGSVGVSSSPVNVIPSFGNMLVYRGASFES